MTPTPWSVRSFAIRSSGEESLATLVAAHPRLGPDAAALVAPGVAVRRRTTPGGAGPEPVRIQLERFRGRLARDADRLARR